MLVFAGYIATKAAAGKPQPAGFLFTKSKFVFPKLVSNQINRRQIEI